MNILDGRILLIDFLKRKEFYIITSLVIILLFSILTVDGVPFKYDWVWSIFNYSSSSIVKDIFQPYSLFDVLLRTRDVLILTIGVVFGTVLGFKILLLTVHVMAGYGMYSLLKGITKFKFVCIIVGIFYTFSPFIFIRTILGYTGSLIAYAVTPIFLKLYLSETNKWFDHLLLGVLFALIFGQVQFGILILLFIIIYHLYTRDKLKKLLFLFIFLLVINIPWIVFMIIRKSGNYIISGTEATTIGYMSMLPHRLRNILMLSDHQIVSPYFYPLAHQKWYLIGWGLIWLIALVGLLNKKTKKIVWPLFIAFLIIFPFLKGPVGMFGFVYRWVYENFPIIAVFRETYHFQFLIVIALLVMFAAGLDFLLRFTRAKWQKIALCTLTVCLVFVGIFPYFTKNYAGFFKLQKIPKTYYQLNDYLKEFPSVCSKIYYPPGLGFVKFKDDKTFNASNGDVVAYSIGIPYVDDGTTFSYLPSEERFYRNELVSQFYEKKDEGQFANLLKENKVDCVIVRKDLKTMYVDASNMHKEKKTKLVKDKWKNENYLKLTEGKMGLKLVKQFDKNIYIFKPDSSYEIPKLDHSKIEPLPDEKIELLSITDWAYNYAYYKDGWSRGRYDFWRKLLFTQLRQDFIYTDKKDSVVEGKVDQRGSYELWARYLTGGTEGNFQISVSNDQFNIGKDAGEERFIVKKLGDVDLKNGKVLIKNIRGENALSDIFLIKK